MSRKEREIKVELGLSGVHYDNFSRFKDSYFRNVYEAAFQRLEDIVNQNKENDDVRMMGGDRASYKYQEFSHILTFIGKRGTGKTSAMLSFMQCLKDWDRVAADDWGSGASFGISRLKQQVTFTCLDCIDGSLLEEGEDIFRVVLAQMYQKFQDEYGKKDGTQGGESEFDYRARELQKNFERLYKLKSILTDMSVTRNHAGESYMSSMRMLASSQKLKEMFQNLTQKYLMMMRYRHADYGESRKQQFLVITIDDLDLNIINGYSMLEEIHRYLMSENIIVLLSMDYDQMIKISMRYFYKVLPKVDSALSDGLGYVRGVAMDYLDKVLPIHYRIYMPETENKNVRYKLRGEKNYKSRKELLLNKLYQKSGIAFDSQGLKRHFYEPKSMRVLSLFVKSLDFLDDFSLSKFRKEKDKKASPEYLVYERNYECLRSDLMTRMAAELLQNEEERGFFDQVLRQNVHRSQEMVIEYARKLIEESELEEQFQEEDSYAMLIQMLYRLGRIEYGIHKPLVQCLISYFSYEYMREYINEIRQTDSEGKNLERETDQASLTKLIAGSVAGRWATEMIPPISIYENSVEDKGTEESMFSGRRPIADLPRNWAINQETRRLYNELFTFVLPRRGSVEIDYLEKLIINMEILYLSMHLSSYADARSKAEWNWKLELDDKNIIRNESTILSKLYKEKEGNEPLWLTGVFNIFNFVENSDRKHSELEKFERAVCKEITRYYGVKVDRTLLLEEQYKKWEDEYKETFPIPIYWFDMTYNLLKRARRNSINKPDSIKKEELFQYIGRVYRDIAEQMGEQERFYQKIDTEIGWQLRKKFEECPYVKYFIDDNLEDGVRDNRASFFAMIADKLIRRG